MSYIVVSALSQLGRQIEQHKPSHIVSLASADFPALSDETQRISLIFNDIVEPRAGLILPEKSHVEELIDFAACWDQKRPMLIHCYAGISRSTASAYIAALALRPQLNEAELAHRLRQLSASATPNSRLIGLADEILRRNGRMISAIGAIGRGADAFEGAAFNLAL